MRSAKLCIAVNVVQKCAEICSAMNKQIIESHATDKAFTGKPDPRANLFGLPAGILAHMAMSLQFDVLTGSKKY